jgi:hypothetical protein
MTIEMTPACTTASQMGISRRPSHGIGRGLFFPALDETIDSVIATSYPVQANATAGHGEGCGAGMGKGTDLADASFRRVVITAREVPRTTQPTPSPDVAVVI